MSIIIYSAKMRDMEVPLGIAGMSPEGIYDLLLPRLHEVGFLYYRRSLRKEKWKWLMPILDAYGESVPLDQRRSVADSQERVDRFSAMKNSSLLRIDFNGPGIIVYVALEGGSRQEHHGYLARTIKEFLDAHG